MYSIWKTPFVVRTWISLFLIITTKYSSWTLSLSYETQSHQAKPSQNLSLSLIQSTSPFSLPFLIPNLSPKPTTSAIPTLPALPTFLNPTFHNSYSNPPQASKISSSYLHIHSSSHKQQYNLIITIRCIKRLVWEWNLRYLQVRRNDNDLNH